MLFFPNNSNLNSWEGFLFFVDLSIKEVYRWSKEIMWHFTFSSVVLIRNDVQVITYKQVLKCMGLNQRYILLKYLFPQC